ncbi:MAG: PAS domain S-box protein [Burkholderiaceae bacterium]|nr:PAS domain S-box protein [Burkholderiaceae bacterium]
MTLLDQLPCAVLITDGSGSVMALNAELLSLIGDSRQRWLGAPVDDMLPPAGRIFLQTHVWPTLLRDGRVNEIHLQLKTAGGERLPVLLNSSRGEHAGQPAFFWTFFSASERHRFEAELVAQRNRADSTSQALQASQRFVTGITDAIPGLVAYWDRELRCRFANPAYQAWFSRAPADMLGARMPDLLGPQLFEQTRPHVDAVLAGQEQRFERALRRPDDSTGHLWVHYLPDRVDNGVVGFYVHAADVTEMKSAQLALAQARHELEREHDRLRNLIDSTQAGTWEWNVRTGEVIVNRRWAEILGWTPQELGPVHNQLRVDLSHPDELANTRHLLREHFAGRTDSYVTEVRLRHRDGRWIWVEDRGRLVTRTADGRAEWMFGVQIDITDRKRRDEALRRSEALLNRTGEAAGVGGWELDLATRQLSWSAQMRRIHGVADDFQPDLDAAIAFFAPQARPMMRGAVEQAIGSGRRWDVEAPVVRADGSRIVVRSVGQVEFEGGRPARLLGALQDITATVEHRRALQAAHQRMALAADSGGIAVFEIDLAAGTLVADAWLVRQYELPPGRGHVPADLWSLRLHADDREALARAVAHATARQRTLEAGFRIVRSDGTRHMRVAARITRDDHGQAQGLVGVSWDVTALQELSARLAQQHELMRVTLQSIGDAVITTDAAGLVTWLNPVAERMTGWPAAEAQGQPMTEVFRIVHEQTREPAPDPVAACLAERRTVSLADPTVLLARDGAEHGIQDSAAPILGTRNEVLGVVLVFHDVSEQRRLTGELAHRATRDALTGLVNRAEFESRLLRALRSAQDDGNQHALLCIDLDHFKQVNDACGHAEGDRLLKQITRLLADAVRGRDTVARLGGDEFAILLEHCSQDQALRVAQKVCDQVDQFRFVHGERRFRVGTSIGLVPVHRRWPSVAALLKAADGACYAAKEAGRNRVQVWSDDDAEQQVRQAQVQWSTRIERALDVTGFALHAQRILPLSGKPRGLRAEVLPGLENEDGSVTLPGAFLPAAERLHLATRIDRRALEALVQRLLALPSLNGIERLSVNLSGQSLEDRAFRAWAVDLLDRAGPGVCRCLGLEANETAAVAHLADARQFFEQVRSRGVQVALDDFGAGASSFGYLKTLPVDVLKIDSQLVANLIDEPLDEAAVRCFVDVARVAGLSTVAGSVERADVRQRLLELGVDDAQGNLLHGPEPLDRVLAIVMSATARTHA